MISRAAKETWRLFLSQIKAETNRYGLMAALHALEFGVWWITQNEYDEKARLLKQQQAEIATRIEQHQTGDDAFRTTLEALISVASRAEDLFDRSKAEQKRKLVSRVFSNLRLSGKKLDYPCVRPSI